jgi:hypothetical protein
MLNEGENFGSNFKVKGLTEIKPGYKVYYYPTGTQDGGRDGTIVEVNVSNGNKWIAIFAYGDVTNRGYTGILTMPSIDQFCVVSRGNGFVVTATNPKAWFEVDCVPVMDVVISKNRNLIIFASYTELVAYGINGIVWTTDRLSFDGLKIVSQNDDFVIGEYFDIRSNRMETFRVNLLDGSHSNSLGPVRI